MPMPELPDIELYLHALRGRVVGHRLLKLRVISPSVLRTFEPPTEAFEDSTVREVFRIGKRIIFAFDRDLFAVVHLMIAGRWQWSDKQLKPARSSHFAMTFENGTLTLAEAGIQRRASLHLLRGREALSPFNPGGIDTLTCSRELFAGRLRNENHTLKRALTDPQLFDGIGNAYADEILHAARVSPVKVTSRITDEEIDRLHQACREVLVTWTDRLLAQFGDRFPKPSEITAFRPDFSVHGRYQQPCPVCGTRVQRIRYAENETDYCPRCQTEGAILADRSLSRLLKGDWPRTVEELENPK